jgi:hypothetical protein
MESSLTNTIIAAVLVFVSLLTIILSHGDN